MAVRFDATGDGLSRSTSPPSTAGYTVCGWASLTNDRNNYQILSSVDNGTSQYAEIGTELDGTTLYIFNHGAAGASLGTITLNAPFFWAQTVNGSGAGNHVGYARGAGQSSLTSTSQSGVAAIASQTFWVGRDGFDSGAYFWDGRIWNVKVWDRVLTPAELLIESFYFNIKFPTSAHLHWPLHHSSYTNDISGNARSATVSGTLTTEDSSHGLWVPRRKIFLPPEVAGVTGTFARTETNDTMSANGTTTVVGTFARTNANDTLSANGTTTVVGTFTRTGGNDTLNASGSVGSPVEGTFTVTETDDTMSASGTTTVVGTLAVTVAADTLSAAGTTTVVGTLAVTVSNDVLAASGTTTIVGTLTVTEGNDTINASGSVGSAVSGTFSVTGANDTMSASGTTTLVGTFTASGTNDTLSASGTTTVLGTMAVTLGNDQLSASGTSGSTSAVNTYLALTNVGR